MELERSVLKFGGSSVSDFTKIKNIAGMLKQELMKVSNLSLL